jgi:hypothetical protein
MAVNVVLGAVAEQTPALQFEATDDLGPIRLGSSHSPTVRPPSFCAYIGAKRGGRKACPRSGRGEAETAARRRESGRARIDTGAPAG